VLTAPATPAADSPMSHDDANHSDSANDDANDGDSDLSPRDAPVPPPAVGVQTRLQKGIKHPKNIPMALFAILFLQLQENQKISMRLPLMKIGSMLCKMNMMLLLPTIPGIYCLPAPIKMSLIAKMGLSHQEKC
jgi:hypothetical protein